MDLAREKEIREIINTSCREGTCCESHFEDLQNYGMQLRKSQRFAQEIEFLNVLGNKDRLMIIKTLFEKGEQCVCELEAILDKSQPSISHHLRALERIGLIRGWKKGKFTYYMIILENFEKKMKLFNDEFKH